jgi:trehalose 6-phosphate phosphatase
MEGSAPLPSRGAAWALFLDIDGTLLDLATTPDAVAVPGGLPPLLDALTRGLSGALALISGRSLAAIDGLFPGGRDAAGNHGAEWRLQGRVSADLDAWPEDLAAELEQAARPLAGVLVERKACALALHYRQAPDQAAAVEELAAAAVRAAPTPLRLLHGKRVIELVPAGASKGKAIEGFMQCPPYTGRTPVFVGDDLTDEEGFPTVRRMGGIGIHVGVRATAAQHRLASPAAVRRWLAAVAGCLSCGSEHANP